MSASAVKPKLDLLIAYMSTESRLRLFDKLCEVIGTDCINNVSRILNIRKNEVYKYVKNRKWSSRRRTPPSPQITLRIILSLSEDWGSKGADLLFDELDRVYEDMNDDLMSYKIWKDEVKRKTGKANY